MEGEVLVAVDGEGEDALVVLQDRRRPVALVDVHIHNDHAPDEPLLEEDARGDDGVVEDAQALAAAANPWWVPPARLADTPSSRAARQAPRVPPEARRERSTIRRDQGNPILHTSLAVSVPATTFSR